MFIARVLYAVDNRLFIWLGEYKSSKVVSDANLHLISFGGIISEIEMGLFRRDLQKGIIKNAKDIKEVEEKYGKDDGKRKKQRQTKKTRNAGG